MKNLVVLPFLVVLVFAQQNPQIIRSYYSIEPSGSYSYSFQLTDGTEKSENVEFVKLGDTENGIMQVKGYYSYVSPDGNKQHIRYTANERGFQPFEVRKGSQPEKQYSVKSITSQSSLTALEDADIPDMPKNIKISGL